MERLQNSEQEQLRVNPFAPTDYVDWIRVNGWGAIGKDSYMLYSGLIPLKEISASAPEGFVSFGDDFTGYSGCFSRKGEGVVYEFDSGTNTVTPTGLRFTEFIAKYSGAL